MRTTETAWFLSSIHFIVVRAEQGDDVFLFGHVGHVADVQPSALRKGRSGGGVVVGGKGAHGPGIVAVGGLATDATAFPGAPVAWAVCAFDAIPCVASRGVGIRVCGGDGGVGGRSSSSSSRTPIGRVFPASRRSRTRAALRRFVALIGSHRAVLVLDAC